MQVVRHKRTPVTSESKGKQCSKVYVQVNLKIATAQWQQHLKKRYKFTLLDVESLYLSQNGVCAICAKGLENPALEETVRFSMSIDHDHNCCPSETTCGLCIRGLLCRDCNLMIGHAKDNLKTLKKAVEYLEQTNKKVGTENL